MGDAGAEEAERGAEGPRREGEEGPTQRSRSCPAQVEAFKTQVDDAIEKAQKMMSRGEL